MWRLRLGDIVTLKKPHACGDNRWEVLRTGADIRIRCLKCRRMLLIPRSRLEPRIRAVSSPSADASTPPDTVL